MPRVTAAGMGRGRRKAIAYPTLPRVSIRCEYGGMKFRLVFLLAAGGAALAQVDAGRPPLFFREDFTETPAATPITQGHLSNAKVALALYGPGKDGMKKSHHDTPADDPYYIWDGTCEGNCLAALHSKAAYADLTG